MPSEVACGLQPSGPRLASIVCANRCPAPAWRLTVGNVCRNCRPADAFRTHSPRLARAWARRGRGCRDSCA